MPLSDPDRNFGNAIGRGFRIGNRLLDLTGKSLAGFECETLEQSSLTTGTSSPLHYCIDVVANTSLQLLLYDMNVFDDGTSKCKGSSVVIRAFLA